MEKKDIIEAIKALTEVVKANNGWLGSERMVRDTNAKIELLIKQL